MNDVKTVVITGASGNLGEKLYHHWSGRHRLRLLDRNPGANQSITAADVSVWNQSWVDEFAGADALFHFAADGIGCLDQAKMARTNVDATVNVFKAAREANVRRIILASSSHVMGQYRFTTEPAVIRTDLEPRPGGEFVQNGWRYDSTAYATTKVFGEVMGERYARQFGLEVIVVRIGFIMTGANLAQHFPERTDEWLKQLWMSNRDFLSLMDRCLLRELPHNEKFAVAHGISRNAGSCWDLESTEREFDFRAHDGLSVDPQKLRLRSGYFHKLQHQIGNLIMQSNQAC